MSKKIIWTEEELNFLKNHFNDYSNVELSIKLNKTPKNVEKTLKRLNIRKNIDSVKAIRTRRNKEVGTDLSFEYISSVAKKYNSRGEFYQFDAICYAKAAKEKWLEKICSHMVVKNTSIPQLMLKDILEFLLKEKCSYNDRMVIKPLEIDCYFYKWKIGWEYDGKYYHNKKNDTIKKKICLKMGISLFNISENTEIYRKYELNIKSQIISNLSKINKITKLSLSKEDVMKYQIQLKLPNVLTVDEKKLVFGKTMTELKCLDLCLFKRIKKYKIYNDKSLNIIFDLKTYRCFKNINEYIEYIKENYDNLDDLYKKEHPHRLTKKWGVDIKVIRDIFKKGNT